MLCCAVFRFGQARLDELIWCNGQHCRLTGVGVFDVFGLAGPAVSRGLLMFRVAPRKEHQPSAPAFPTSRFPPSPIRDIAHCLHPALSFTFTITRPTDISTRAHIHTASIVHPNVEALRH
jgi:hypothetical protein